MLTAVRAFLGVGEPREGHDATEPQSGGAGTPKGEDGGRECAGCSGVPGQPPQAGLAAAGIQTEDGRGVNSKDPAPHLLGRGGGV